MLSDARTVGIDVGGTGIKWAVLEAGELVDHGDEPTPRTGTADVLDLIAAIARSVGDAIPLGLAMPGTIDTERRRTILVPNVPGEWSGLEIGDEIERRCSSSVIVRNDARSFARAELHGRNGQDAGNTLFITVGTGVGGAIAWGDRILVGELDNLGEMGHVMVDRTGEVCGCGGRGCLETIASGTAIVARLARPMAMRQSAILNGLAEEDPTRLTAHLIAQAAESGDPWARDAFDRAARAIGAAAASICMVLQLHSVVIGGGLAPALPLMAPVIESILNERVSITGPITLRQSILGSKAGSIGAALFALDHLGGSTPGRSPSIERNLPS